MFVTKKDMYAFSLLLLFGTTLGASAQPESAQPKEAMAAESIAPVELTEEEQKYLQQVEALKARLKPQTGKITLPNGVATLDVPESFYYLSPDDTEVVLTEIWGNPSSGELTLGMLFPANSSPLDANAWGVTIQYVEEGYVDDDDAAELNYDDLLASMREDTASGNEWRKEQGYEPISLVGWAKQPYYDASTKKLYWAKELQFGDDAHNTLNYNIRVLGRKGYLLLNFIASMDQLSEIDQKLPTVLAIAEFNEGNRYGDFNPDIDQVAAYGLGALVAGKVIAKTGLIAMLLLLVKKFGVIILVALGGLAKALWNKRR